VGLGLLAGFAVGVATSIALLKEFPRAAAWLLAVEVPVSVVDVRPAVAPRPRAAASRTDFEGPPEATIGPDVVADLRHRRLQLPVQGVATSDLRSTFHDRRDQSREHEALDILAARNTPVLAVEDGRIAKFFVSKAGGNTIYQFDPSDQYAYYYAHLERYAEGLDEGDRVHRGETIGYVGTSGNAPKNTPHLHFAIFRLFPEKQWWRGTPLDPFEVWQPATPVP
jgi:murein DD-endopeptidase MepM/ murein hydrolase activator NlpD